MLQTASKFKAKQKEKQDLKKLIKKRLGVSFKKPSMLESALQHPSYRNEHPGPVLEDFDRLEFFGDTILNFVICRKLFKVFPKENEGMLSRLRSTLVSKKILSRIAKNLGFLTFVRLGKGLREQKNESKAKILADAFEAFLAAFYFDQGMAKTEEFILKQFRSYLDIKRLFRLDPNPKSMLQEISQKHWQKLPCYHAVSSPQGAKVTVWIHANKKASAQGKTKKEAEEKAARLLLKKVRQDLSLALKRASSGKKLRRTL